MLGTSVDLTTIRMIFASQRNEQEYDVQKLEILKLELIEKIKRVAGYEFVKKFEPKIMECKDLNELNSIFNEMVKLILEQLKIEREMFEAYKKYLVRLEQIEKEAADEMFKTLTSNFDILKIDKVQKMKDTVRRFSDNGDTMSLFEMVDGDPATYIDDANVTHYKINEAAFDFTLNDIACDFAKTYNFKVYGHAIVWHEAVPPQLVELKSNSEFSPEQKKQMTLDFLQSYMQAYVNNANKNGILLDRIDILNEIASDDENNDEMLRESVFKDLIGDDYYIEVLKMAKQVFPIECKLVYNDMNEFNPVKRQKIIEVLNSISAEEERTGTKLLDAVGLEGHLFGYESKETIDETFDQICEAADKSGYEVFVSELDCLNRGPTGVDVGLQQELMAQVITSAKEHGMEDVCTWSAIEPFNDSISETEGTGLIDKNGDTHDSFEVTVDTFSEVASAQVGDGTSTSAGETTASDSSASSGAPTTSSTMSR